VYHFALAFHSLGDRIAIPCCANKLQDLCLYKGERKEDKFPLSDWDLALCISDKVNKSYLHCGKDVAPLLMGVFADEDLSDKINRGADTFDSLSFSLSLLLEKPQKFELFGIASASFLLQRENTNLNPVYSRISSALLDLVTEQDHWFFKTEDTDVADLEKKSSAVSLHVDPQIFRVIDANRKACVSVEKTLGLVQRGQVIDSSVKTPPHYYAVVCKMFSWLNVWLVRQELLFLQHYAWKHCQNVVPSLMKRRGNKVKWRGSSQIPKSFFISNVC
jgi:hypothetical protein